MSVEVKIGEIIDKIFLGFQKMSPALIAIAITCGLIIFAPKAWLEKLGIAEFPTYVIQIIGSIFLLSIFLILSILFFIVIKRIRSAVAMKKIEKSMEELTPEELKRVIFMFYSPGNTLSMSVQDGVTGALVMKGIITHASNVGDGIGLFTFQYMLQPWAVRYLKKHIDDYNIPFEEIERDYNAYMSAIRRL